MTLFYASTLKIKNDEKNDVMCGVDSVWNKRVGQREESMGILRWKFLRNRMKF
jgi:hypothetical protein